MSKQRAPTSQRATSQSALGDVSSWALQQGSELLGAGNAAVQSLLGLGQGAGGTQGQGAPAPPAPAVASGPATTVVAPGESLGLIAERLGQPRGAYRALFDANRDVLSDPNQVEVGTVLRLPDGWEAAGEAAQSASEAAEYEAAPSAAPEHQSGRFAHWAALAQTVGDVAWSVGAVASERAQGAIEPYQAWLSGEAGKGGDRAAKNENQDASALPAGWGEARESRSLAEAEKYIDQVQTYGFGQYGLLASKGGEKRGEMTQMWCSGLTTATLLDMGVPVDAPIEGQFYYENGVRKQVTVRHLVEGMAEPLAATAELGARLDRVRPTAEDLAACDGDAKKARARAVVREMWKGTKFGDDVFGADTDLRAQGAVGAFILSGIGQAVRDPGQTRPGDFVQTRTIGSPDGHAFQVWEVEATGDAIFGLPGSPELVAPGEVSPHAASGGEVHRGARFRLGAQTAPELVLAATTTRWSVIESNVKGVTSKASAVRQVGGREGPATKARGGVVVRAFTELPTESTLRAENRQLYIGRLDNTTWGKQVLSPDAPS